MKADDGGRRVDDALWLARRMGISWALLCRVSERGESVLVRGGSLGLSGEEIAEANWGFVHGPRGVREAFSLFVLRIRERGLPGMIGVLNSVAGEVEALAGELGLTSDETAPLMACRSDTFRPPRPEPGWPAGLVTGREEAEEAVAVVAEAYGDGVDVGLRLLGGYPKDNVHVDYFLSRVDGHAAASVTTARLGRLVGIYNVGTRPALRRRGAASAAMTAALRYHIERGVQVFTLGASSTGEPVYRALGFETVDRLALWLVDPEREPGYGS
jgi:ribosomal protein S18 acetylase RimI-like enzyme